MEEHLSHLSSILDNVEVFSKTMEHSYFPLQHRGRPPGKTVASCLWNLASSNSSEWSVERLDSLGPDLRSHRQSRNGRAFLGFVRYIAQRRSLLQIAGMFPAELNVYIIIGYHTSKHQETEI